MPRGVRHSDEVRAAVMAALLAGQGVNEVAEAYHLPPKTVQEWAYRNQEFRQLQEQKRFELDDLITEYVKEVFITLSVQARHFRGTPWLNEQSADEVAVLHGVLADKAVRILAAAEQPGGSEDVGTPGGPTE